MFYLKIWCPRLTSSRLLGSSLFIALLLMVSGCQQQSLSSFLVGKADARPSTVDQLDQLSSVLSGALFLKRECQRDDIPTEANLHSSALVFALKQGWNLEDYDLTDEMRSEQLAQLSEQKYQTIQLGSESTTEKCLSFGKSLAPFMVMAKKDQRRWD